MSNRSFSQGTYVLKILYLIHVKDYYNKKPGLIKKKHKLTFY